MAPLLRNHILSLCLALAAAAIALPAFADGSAPREAQGALVSPRQIVAEVAADSAPTIVACDPANPASAALEITGIRKSTVAGFAGTVVSGELLNHCNSVLTDIVIEPGATGAFGASGEQIPTAFPLVLPDKGTPFTAIYPADATVPANPTFHVTAFKIHIGNVPLLQLHGVITTSNGTDVTVNFTLSNPGLAAAVTPMVAARLEGGACGDPWAVQFANHGNELEPNQSANDSIVLPQSCTGAVQLMVGSDAPANPPLPQSLTLRDGQVAYDDAGNLRVFATLCDGHTGAGDYLFPLLHLSLAGPSGTVHADAANTGFYPSGGCGPFATTFDNPAAGLQFGGLVSYEGDQVIEPFAELPEEEQWLETFAALNPNLPRLYLRAADGQPTDANQFAALLFNPNDVEGTNANYRVLGIARDTAGNAAGGLDLADPPAVPPHSWAVVSVTPGDGSLFQTGGAPIASIDRGYTQPMSP